MMVTNYALPSQTCYVISDIFDIIQFKNTIKGMEKYDICYFHLVQTYFLTLQVVSEKTLLTWNWLNNSIQKPKVLNISNIFFFRLKDDIRNVNSHFCRNSFDKKISDDKLIREKKYLNESSQTFKGSKSIENY